MTEPEEFSRLLDRFFSPIRPLAPCQVAALYGHYSLLTRWNRVLNLTRIRDLHEAVVRHYCESLFLGTMLPENGASVLDVGSGAGFPGVPMAVLRPDCRFTLAESHQRKAAFLRESTRELANVTVAARRAEQCGTGFDWLVSRAVHWEALQPLIRQPLRHIALLTSSTETPRIQSSPQVAWRSVIPLPWGRTSVALVGDVPRGT